MFTTKWFQAELSFEGQYVETLYLPRIYDVYGLQVSGDLVNYRQDGTPWSGQVDVDACGEFTETETRLGWMS